MTYTATQLHGCTATRQPWAEQWYFLISLSGAAESTMTFSMPGKYERHFDPGLYQQLYILYIKERWLSGIKTTFLSFQTKDKDVWKCRKPFRLLELNPGAKKVVIFFYSWQRLTSLNISLYLTIPLSLSQTRIWDWISHPAAAVRTAAIDSSQRRTQSKWNWYLKLMWCRSCRQAFQHLHFMCSPVLEYWSYISMVSLPHLFKSASGQLNVLPQCIKNILTISRLKTLRNWN